MLVLIFSLCRGAFCKINKTLPSPGSGLSWGHVSARSGSLADIIFIRQDPPDLDVFGTPYFTVSLSETLSVGSEDKQAGPDREESPGILNSGSATKESSTLGHAWGPSNQPHPWAAPSTACGQHGVQAPRRMCQAGGWQGPCVPCFEGCEAACPHSQKLL